MDPATAILAFLTELFQNLGDLFLWLIDNIPFLSDLFDLIFVAIDNIVGDITQVGYCFGNGIEIYGNPLPWALSSCIDDKQFDCDMHECFDELLICMEKNATGHLREYHYIGWLTQSPIIKFVVQIITNIISQVWCRIVCVFGCVDCNVFEFPLCIGNCLIDPPYYCVDPEYGLSEFMNEIAALGCIDTCNNFLDPSSVCGPISEELLCVLY